MISSLKHAIKFIFWVALLFTNSFAYAQVPDFRLSGYAKGSFSMIDESSFAKTLGFDTTTEERSNIRLRLKLFSQIGDRLSLDMAYELLPRYEPEKSIYQKGIFFNTSQISYRAEDVNERIYHKKHGQNSFSLYQDIDRAYMTISFDSADLYVGRQPISFGSGRALNPTDVLAPFSLDAIDKEDRKGVDALRFRLPFGDMGELDGGVIFGDHFKSGKSAAYLNTKFSLKETDYALMSMLFRENLLIGADIQTPLADAGYWLEAAYTFAGAIGNKRAGENYLRVSTGLDYNISADLYAFIEYHFNGAGEDSPKDYLKVSNETAYRESQVYLLSRHYLVSGFIYKLADLCNLQTNIMINLRDGSFFISPRLQYSLMQDLYIEAGAFVSLGKKSKLSSDNREGMKRVEACSEFGLYQNLYFVSVSYYFSLD